MATFSNLKSKEVGTSVVTLGTFTAATIITGCNIANRLGSSASVSLYVENSTNIYYIFKDKVVNGGEATEAITGNKIVLVNGDSLKAVGSVGSAFDIIVSKLDGI